MEKLSFDRIDILLIDPDRVVRTTMRNILIDNGFRHVTVGSGMADIETKMRIGMPDLLISDLKLEDGNLNAFIYGLRHHDVGSNPFLPVIVTTWSPTTEDVRAIVQSGADDMITKPLSAGQLLQRIKALIKSRKPFVVTSGYIGPDRRKPGADHDRGVKIDPIEVPNTLRAKALGEGSTDINQIQAQIDACIKKVNLEKLDRHSHQITWLVERIVPAMTFGAPDEATTKSLERLLFVGEDISRRMVGTKFEHVGELCKSLINVTQRILDAGDFPAHKDIDLLKPLAQSIQRGFDESDEEAARTAREISDTVSR
ncbi:response regulator [Magnetovibrio sp.]|uniref:response regulator transcription factor n=1 Tax=Magnetovibrio sp. TaxID=2024836 RepID=UPI002F956E25